MHGGNASGVRSRGQLAPPGQIRQRTSPSPSPARASAQPVGLSAFDPYAPAEPAAPSSHARRRAPRNFFDDDADASEPGWGSDASNSSAGSDSKSRHPRSRARSGAEPLAGLADVLDDWDQVARRTQAKLEDWFGLPPASPNRNSRPPSAGRTTENFDGNEVDQVRVLVHQVQSGDTLPGLAVRYGAPLPTLRRVNGLWDRDMTLARSVVYIPLDACTHPAPAGSTQTMLPASGTNATDTSSLRARPHPPLASGSGAGPGPPPQASRPRSRTPVSPVLEQHGRAALPSPLLEARLAPAPPPATGSRERYAPRSSRSSDAFLIDLSEGSDIHSVNSSARAPSTSAAPQPGLLDGDSVAAIPTRELGYFPAPLHPTPLHAGTRPTRAPDKHSDDTSRDSLDSLARMSAARSAGVLHPPETQNQSQSHRSSGPLAAENSSAASNLGSAPLAPGLKPLRLSSSASTRPGANLLASTNAPKPGVKVNKAYSGAALSSDPDSSAWSALLAGLPPNSGSGANWARPIGLPTERRSAKPAAAQRGGGGNEGGAPAWSANDWSTLLGDTIRGRVPLDTAFQQAADKVGQDLRDWTLEPSAGSSSRPRPVPGAQPPSSNFRPLASSASQPPTRSAPMTGSSSAGLGDVPPSGLASRRKVRPPTEESIQLL